MAELSVHGRKISSIFELLGNKENDITYSIGWCFAKCPIFLKEFVREILPTASAEADIFLQEHEKKSGITDIEIRGNNFHVIIEAKRGWTLPVKSQLMQYAKKLNSNLSENRILVAMSECSHEYSDLHLVKNVDGVPVYYKNWGDIIKSCRRAKEASSHAEKRLLDELIDYLKGIAYMQNQESNLVYVVSLAGGIPEWSKISWIDIVEKKLKYFHPVGGNGWPKSPPNYIGFRYDGKLQSIHHVDSYKIVNDLSIDIQEISETDWEPHFLYSLGPAIKPTKVVKTGNIYPSGRIWAMLDLLLTCESISDARDKTKERLSEER